MKKVHRDYITNGAIDMNITLSQLTLRNFKGVRNLTADFSSLTEVYGDNATGKTTLFDAFSWLLFDKDSQNKKDFDIKTLDGNGNVLHGLEHEVEANLVVDGRSQTLRKVFMEKRTKKRGSASSELTGHTTDYFINGVPVKLKEFKAHVDGLIDEGLFKLLTSPTFFNEQLDWKSRRKTLLEICGDVSDSEVIASNGELSKLPAILQGREIEDHRKIIAARRAEINKELDKIPVRIDEAERSKPDVSGLSESELDLHISRLRSEIEQKEMELSRLQSGGEVAVYEKRLREIESEMLEIKNNAQANVLDVVNQRRTTVMSIENEVHRIESDIRTIKNKVEGNGYLIESKKEEASRLRKQWTDLDNTELDLNHDENCPACGQSLPEEQIEAAHKKALENFNRDKSERLERISIQGRRLMAEAMELEHANVELAQSIEDKTNELNQCQLRLSSARQELDRLQVNVTDVKTLPAYVAKVDEYEQVSSKLITIRSSVQESISQVRDQLMAIRNVLHETETKKSSFAQVRNLDIRIDELQQQERKLAEEFERLEEELYLTEEFIRTKVNLLESKINSKFRYARFKLFETQINGGLAETCETLYQGVPYGSGLNNAARINVGLDIINTLSAHYGIKAPIFVDNAEAVTQLADTSSQVIALYVSESDKTLRFETTDRVQEAV